MSEKTNKRAFRAKYSGGKNGEGVYQRIINIIPPHTLFIEACAGSAAITRMIKPANKTIIIEAEPIQANQLRIDLVDRAVVINDSFYNVVDIEEPTGETRVVFIDPPYMKEVRSYRGNLYRIEWNLRDHIELINWLHQLEGMAIVTHPRCELYEEGLRGWKTIDFEYQSRQGKRCDCIWFNYELPEQLHDYSYVGTNRSERQSIDRHVERYLHRIGKMDAHKRNKLIEAIINRYVSPVKEDITTLESSNCRRIQRSGVV